jgi:hypothetical protein
MAAPPQAAVSHAPAQTAPSTSAPEAALAISPQIQLLKANESNVVVDIVVTDAKMKPAFWPGHAAL